MSKLTRRSFVKSTAAASAAFPLFTIAGTKASGRVLGANDTIRVGVAGIRSRGEHHLNQFAAMENVDVTYLIDPDSRLFESRAEQVRDKGGNRPECVQDVREALDDSNLDVVSIATCNHWHSLITVWACQAEKDVYVEKPMSHNVWEGRQCVEAMRRHNCIVQHGTQQRSNSGRARQMAAIQSGRYGKLLISKGYCCKPRWSIGVEPITSPPSEFDFNLWLGPAPEQAYHGNLHPYDWHWFWDFGNGDTGNQGVHEMDVARWAIEGSTLPDRVWSLGGRWTPDGPDQGQTPNMQLSGYHYGDVLLLFETRGLVDRRGTDAPPRQVENEFYTTEGVIRGGRFYPNGSSEGEPVQGGDATVTPGGEFGSFIHCVRTRDADAVNGDAEVAHYSSALCHLANVSYRLGEPASFQETPEVVTGDEQTRAAFEMVKENLELVGVDLADESYQLGRVLDFNPETETFVNDDEANALLTRPYRREFEVPKIG